MSCETVFTILQYLAQSFINLLYFRANSVIALFGRAIFLYEFTQELPKDMRLIMRNNGEI